VIESFGLAMICMEMNERLCVSPRAVQSKYKNLVDSKPTFKNRKSFLKNTKEKKEKGREKIKKEFQMNGIIL